VLLKEAQDQKVFANDMFDTSRIVLVECIRSVYICMRSFNIRRFLKADLTTIIGCRIHLNIVSFKVFFITSFAFIRSLPNWLRSYCKV